jgi:hypothetical protein
VLTIFSTTGHDVPVFSGTVTMPAAPAVDFGLRAGTATSDYNITWTPTSADRASIALRLGPDDDTSHSIGATCAVDPTAGVFAIPAAVFQRAATLYVSVVFSVANFTDLTTGDYTIRLIAQREASGLIFLE